MVTPTGNTNDDTSSETPKCFCVRSMVKGKVAALELVVKASICTGAAALKNCFIVRLPKTRMMNGYTNKMMTAKASTTVRAYKPKAEKMPTSPA